MQIVVHFRKTSVLQFDDAPCGAALRESISAAEQVPAECFYMHVDGKHLADCDILSLSSSMVVRASIKINGGKGGFGAMLKSMAKQAGSKKTTDFGACRDLSGRRLRHVNDELILKKWQEAKDRGDEFDTTENTQSGIDMWFLSAPSWAEGVKTSHHKKYMKGRTKTRLCLDWLQARSEGQRVPRNAPAHWGCPRGPRCEFAHGEEELQGDAKQAREQQQRQERYAAERQKRDTYMGAVESNRSSEEMSSMVAAGLGKGRAGKRIKPLPASPTSSSAGLEGGAGAGAGGVLEEVLVAANEEPVCTTAESSVAQVVHPAQQQQEEEALPLPPAWLQVVPSSSSSLQLHEGGVVQCTEGFGTVLVSRDMQRQEQGKEQSREQGKERWYFEMELITGGLMQIGWVDHSFGAVSLPPSSSSEKEDQDKNQDQEDQEDQEEGAGECGVGDDAHSWAYDGFRQMSWSGAQAAYPATKRGKRKGAHDGSGIWKAGDTVGCLLEVDPAALTGEVSFQLNGADLGVAFGADCESLCEAVKELCAGGGQPLPLRPGVSLEEGQSAAINIGQRPFKHNNFQNARTVYSLLQHVVSGSCATSSAETKPTEVLTGTEGAGRPAAAMSSTEPCVYGTIDLESPAVLAPGDLEALGLGHLRAELARRGLKAGGTLQQCAGRLFAARGLQAGEIPKKLLASKSTATAITVSAEAPEAAGSSS